ncbi:hypothetical protein T265_00751 [Opisthorchis viverrini]|uniref:One cut domain family member n=1 Tax=Opisthorchis viverrini TaxID=6198 RepID=A0A075A575_OPIVI|nr:hypothetical protein T265_00751 [Opisthorchis viverrini]KER33447.1 hypothetical protein T265_00751 [Opisthorchis viverrini]
MIEQIQTLKELKRPELVNGPFAAFHSGPKHELFYFDTRRDSGVKEMDIVSRLSQDSSKFTKPQIASTDHGEISTGNTNFAQSFSNVLSERKRNNSSCSSSPPTSEKSSNSTAYFEPSTAMRVMANNEDADTSLPDTESEVSDKAVTALVSANDSVFTSGSNPVSSSPCILTFPAMSGACDVTASHPIHAQLTNERNASGLTDRLSSAYPTNGGAVLPAEPEPALQALHTQAGSNSYTDLRLFCEPFNTIQDRKLLSNYGSLTDDHILPSINRVSDQFNLVHPADLSTSSIDSTVAAASDVMSYMQQHGPLTYGHPDSLFTTHSRAHTIDQKSFSFWNKNDFELNRTPDGGTLFRDPQAPYNITLNPGQRSAPHVPMGLKHSLVAGNPPMTYNGRPQTEEMPGAPPGNMEQHVQLRNGNITDAINFRAVQPQGCYPYGSHEMEFKPELKNVLEVQIPHNQSHIPGHLCRPSMISGAMGQQNLQVGPIGLSGVVNPMHPRHAHVPHPIQEMEEINTKALAQRISAELKRYSIPQAVFAQRVLCRSQGTLSDLLRNPKPWSKLKSGRETFRRMWKWLQEPEFQRMSTLRLAACKRKEVEHVKTPDSRQSKKPRLVFTDIQRRTLHAIFKETKRPSKEMQSTIAQQLGLEVSTVANFFMNARRRSLDKWQEDCSKGSSLAGSPSPDSPSSRTGVINGANNLNACMMKETSDPSSNGPVSPTAHLRHSGNIITFSTSGSTAKSSDLTYNMGSRTDRVLRSSALAGAFSTHPSGSMNSNQNGHGGSLFQIVQRNAPIAATFVPSSVNQIGPKNIHNMGHRNLQLTSSPDSQQTHPVHHSNLAHQPNAFIGSTHQRHQQLTQHTGFVDRGEPFSSVQSNNISSSLTATTNAIPSESVYAHLNTPRPHPTLIFPSTGLHSQNSLGSSHLGLFHSSGTPAQGQLRSPHFLMRDFSGHSPFDHNFLSTMTSGQRVLTEQALEWCNSLAAANAANLATSDQSEMEQSKETKEYVISGHSKVAQPEGRNADNKPTDATGDDDLSIEQDGCSSLESVSQGPLDETESIERGDLDTLQTNYYNDSTMDPIKDDLSNLSEAICGLVGSNNTELDETIDDCDSDQT